MDVPIRVAVHFFRKHVAVGVMSPPRSTQPPQLYVDAHATLLVGDACGTLDEGLRAMCGGWVLDVGGIP